MKKVITTSLIVLAGILNAKTQLEFQQLIYVAEPHDLIEIKEVNLIDAEALEIGSTIEVTGSYELGSTNNALLGLSITSKENDGTHFPEPSEQKKITKGSGEFKLVRKVDRNGGIHVSIYPQTESGRYEQSTSRLYFLELNH